MEKSTNELLEEIMRNELEYIKTYDLDAEERNQSVEYIRQLNDIRIKQIGNDDNLINKKREDIMSYAKLGIELCGIVLPLALYSVWMNRGLEWEKTGTFTSTTFKGLFSKFKTTR